MFQVFKTGVATVLTVIILFAAGGCKGKKDMPTIQSGSERLTVPFSSAAYRTDGSNFRAVNMGTSVDYSMARRIALQNARTELAAGIAATVKAVTAQYADQRQVADRQEFQTRLEEESRTVVNQMLTDVRVIGDETFREPDGRMTVWVAIEMPKDALVQAMSNSISRDERLRLDFDQHRFRQIFDEEMNKFESNR